MQKQLLAILVCPVTKSALVYNKEAQELISYAARLAYPIKEGVPMLLEDEARPLTDDELEHRLS